ncbi:MAG: CoA-binding protein [Candidatus Lokiarchaeota archaeon]|nr:CoA-binding protein [Candidatus Lokiarchaeota archaeon]
MNLEPFFNPKSLVIIGASRKEFTFNQTVLRNLLDIRFRGNIYIINPNTDELLGIRSYNDLSSLPEVPELAIIMLRNNLKDLFEELGKFGIKNVMIESELGEKSINGKVIQELGETCNKYDIRYMGPSMIGVMNYIDNFTTSIIPVRRHILQKNRGLKYGVSIIIESGGLAGGLGWWSPSQNLPISKVIHLGEGYKIDIADTLFYLEKDETTRVIALFLRQIDQTLIDAVSNIAPIKPILFFYVGKDTVAEESLKTAGGLAVQNYIELFEFSKLFLWLPKPGGNKLGIIGPSSGAILLIVKEMRKQGLSLAKPSQMSQDLISMKIGGSTCEYGNPVDYWPPKKFIGTEICTIYYLGSEILLNDDDVDGLILALEFFQEIEFDFYIFSKIKEKFPNKPIITLLIQAEQEGAKRVVDIATELKIPVFENEVERAVRGYAMLLKYYKDIKKE